MLRISYTTIILVVAMALCVSAGTPTAINYQGVLADSLGNPIADDTYSVIFTIYDDATSGSVIWTETQNVTTVSGQFAVLIGSVNPIVDPVFSESVRYLGIQFGANPESDPRIMMVTVPYAFRVATVDGATGGNITDKLSIGSGHTNTGAGAFVAGINNIASGQVTSVVGFSNTASGYIASVGGGHNNVASGWSASVGGGESNTAGDTAATVSGGFLNSANVIYSAIGGGRQNSANGWFASVGGGGYNAASGNQSTVSGGYFNTASQIAATVGGGMFNHARGRNSVVAGGGGATRADSNSASGAYSAIGGGRQNSARRQNATVGGGWANTVDNVGATIAGGSFNRVSGFRSAILGGYADTITSTGNYSYLFGIASKLTQDSTFMVDMPHVRFGDEATGYELPASDGAVDQVMSTDGAGQLSWTTVSGGGGGGWADDGTVVRLETSSDSVGIGTSTPSEMLEVDGNVLVTGKATIGSGHTNTGTYAFVAGNNNTASQIAATVGGGKNNRARGAYSVVAGGGGADVSDSNSASGLKSAILGGSSNIASTTGASVGGGYGNTASGTQATVGGGYRNTASGIQATVGGGGSNSVSGRYSAILGGYADTIDTDADYSYLFGIGSKLTQDSTFMVDMPHVRFGDEATGYELPASDGTVDQVMSTDGAGQLSWTTVSGGDGNWTLTGDVLYTNGEYGIARAGNILYGTEDSTHVNLGVACTTGTTGGSYAFATVSGGWGNTAGGNYATAGGGSNNKAEDTAAMVGGGKYNYARGIYSVVAGGGGLTAFDSNSASGAYSVIGGGRGNIASGNEATVDGGRWNTSSAAYTSVGGGWANTASSNNATVSGGDNNTANSAAASVGGGTRNTASGFYSVVGGGSGDTASGRSATVGGGYVNIARGDYSAVPGGFQNEAGGDFSLAAGRRAKALHPGSFVWADQHNADFSSSADDQFNVRASGGTRIYSNSGRTSGVTLAAGGSSWVSVCDSTVKRNIREVDYQDVLEKVAELPISRWSYKSQDESIEHIGPMAQDFYRLFGLDEDDKHINTLDPDGVALAAIKALYEQNQKLEGKIEDLQKLVEKLVVDSK